MAPPAPTARRSQPVATSPNLLTSVAPAPAGLSTYRAADPVRVESLQACVEAARRSMASLLPMVLLTEMTRAAAPMAEGSTSLEAGGGARGDAASLDGGRPGGQHVVHRPVVFLG